MKAIAWKILFALSVVLVLVSPTLAQNNLVQETFTFDATKPISMASDRLEVDNKLKTANFIGNVVAVQGDIMMNADMVSIHYAGEDKPAEKTEKDEEASGLSALTGGSQKIQSIVAAGQVYVEQGKRKAQCEQIIFDQDKGVVTLTGSPKLFWGSDMLQGQKIVVYIDTQRVEVVGAPNQRVQATVMPKNFQNEFPDKAKNRLKDLTDNPPPKPEDQNQADPTKAKPGEKKKKPGYLIYQEPKADGQ